MITIEVNDKAVQAAINRMLNAGQDLTPAFESTFLSCLDVLLSLFQGFAVLYIIG